MFRQIAISVSFAALLGGCSYGYDLTAVVQNGQLMFVVSPTSSQKPECLRDIEVAEEGGQRNTLWSESVSYDDYCANKFPISYGKSLEGQRQQDRKEVQAMPLRPGVIYNVSTTTDATGYGGGRFLIHADGHVENLPWPSTNAHENAAAP
ncbi:hypothetical protein [Sphingobium yanoikuyae]|jgi:hypothetical protein|uniref:hypothetical protein n=1 Tax=Sphingobium yanoikuyae TaxID=13690 RepID=UPI00241C7FE3|nr:hypothetical protein [Sphingobium yanoikuyae]